MTPPANPADLADVLLALAERCKPVPCQHIADYYQRAWERHKCIAYNLLRIGYRQWAAGSVPHPEVNNIAAAIRALSLATQKEITDATG